MPLRPLRNLLYILPIDDESLTSSGLLYLPDTNKQRTDQGIIKYRGPNTSGELRVGDHVFFSGYDGDEIVIEGEGRLIIIPEPFIDAVWTDGEDNYTLTIPQVQNLVTRTAGDIATTLDESEQVLVRRLGKMVNERLEDSAFTMELYF